MAKRWQQADVAYLKRYARSKPMAELAARLRTDVASVRAKVKELGAASPSAKPAKAAAKPAKRAKRPAKPKKAAAKPAKRAAKPAAKAAKRTGKSAPRAVARRAARPAKAKPAKRPTPTRPTAAPVAARRASTPPVASTPTRSAPAAPWRPTPAPRPPAPPKPNPDTARLLPLFEQGLQAMHRHEWPTAIGLFSRLVAAGDDEPELTGRARQFLSICQERQAENGAQHEVEDPYVLAVYHRNRGDLAMALSVARRSHRHRRDERLAYLVAVLHAERGEASEAAEMLGIAIELNPLNRGQALVDPDFAELRERGELAALLRRTP